MREPWRICIRAVLAAGLLSIAAPPRGRAAAPPPPEDFGTVHRMAPTGEVIVSWTYNREVLGSSLEIFGVEDGEVTGTYNAGFPIKNVEFSLSGRFMCIAGHLVTSDAQNQPQYRSRVLVVDTALDFKTLMNLTGTSVTNFEGRSGKGTSHRCLPSPATLSPKLDFEGRVNRMVRIENVNRRGVICPGRGVPYNYGDTTTQFWDPGNPTRPLMFAKFVQTKQVDGC